MFVCSRVPGVAVSAAEIGTCYVCGPLAGPRVECCWENLTDVYAVVEL